MTLQAMWKNWLIQTVKPQPHNHRTPAKPPRTCIVGVGSDLRGDDTAGVKVSRSLRRSLRRSLSERVPVEDDSRLLVLDGGPAPENLTGALRSFQPELVVFVDAAHMEESPGTIQWIPLEVIDGMSASTHSLPLSMLAHYLTLELGCDVAVLGIQPGQNEFSSQTSPPVRAAIKEVVAGIKDVFAVLR